MKNIYGQVAIDLDKTADTAGIQDSLFEKETTLTYTLKPEVKNTYALDSYTLTDDGLTAYHEETLLDSSSADL